MFVGHFAVSLALKKFEKRVSLDVFFLSVQRASITLPIQWPLLAESGHRKIEISRKLVFAIHPKPAIGVILR